MIFFVCADADITSTNMSSGVQVEADETDPEAMSLVDDVSTEYFTSYEDMNVRLFHCYEIY